MLQLLKYEFYKKWKLFLIVICILALAQGIILYQLLVKDNWVASLAIFTTIGYAGAIFIFIDSILSYSKELNNKSGYMLFLTPRNTYQILGSKVLISFIELIIGFVIFVSIGYINYGIFANVFTEVFEFGDFVISFAEGAFILKDILTFIFLALMQWFNVIITAYLSITLSTTLLSQSKLKGLISFILFFVISYFISYIINFARDLLTEVTALSFSSISMISTVILLITSFILYILSAKLLNKYVNL
ncbi:hypothetical protein EDC19_2331 [Natranaerovirga hydrolytica]|uniref:ABC-2 family transporter n=1 Tax=Natranaerovirga hydrolytica TaxID=680378 RepID=A0A4R1MFP3_9FIRM|nr:hypothetical protein [Natranaerovirga hydrolytica]TCK90562.1 hypothetical protein EDC19_2331 [Natranaerovirga hydrolytica]